MKFSVIIGTKDRPESLARTLDSLFGQSQRPEEIILIDDGILEEEEWIRKIEEKGIAAYCYHKSEDGIVASRNLGAKMAKGDILLFLDDDVILSPAYIQAIAKVYQRDPVGRIGGVGGAILHSYSPLLKTALRFFCLDSLVPGKVLPSGCCSLITGIQQPLQVDWLSGCNMSYRREIFREFSFDERFGGNGWGDDRDFSYRVGKKYRLVAASEAQVVHLEEPSGRASRRIFGRRETQHLLLFFSKNMPKRCVNRLALAWALIGIGLKNVVTFRWDQCLGNLEGAISFRPNASPPQEFHFPASVKVHFNRIAADYDGWKQKNRYYYEFLKGFFSREIPPGQRVCELGCGTGEILNAVAPKEGVGIDVSEEMVRIAKRKNPGFTFVTSEAERLALRLQSDYVILSDIIDHLMDIWEAFKETRRILKPGGKLVLTTINPFWEPLLDLGEKLGLKMSEGPHNFIFKEDIVHLLELLDFKIEREGYSLFLPKRVPLIGRFLNWAIPRIPLLRRFCLIQYVVAIKQEQLRGAGPLSCSVVIPCHDESGNIVECIRRVPTMGTRTEIIVVDDGSTDGTYRLVKKLQREMEHLVLLSHTPRQGKGFAVKRGFEAATGDVLMILDADASVSPEDLPKFFEPIAWGKADFVNGSRMVYPMEDKAMQGLNRVGNILFGKIFSLILRRRLKDTLCGTKALLRKHYRVFEMAHCHWGDFDLLFGAARLGLRVVEMPIRYRRRRHGRSKMMPAWDGFQFLRTCVIGTALLFREKYLHTKRGHSYK